MRDFRRDELDAAHPETVLPFRDFSWSLSSHDLFQQCLLAWWIRYGLSRGGWDVYASDLAAMAREAGKTLPRTSWTGLFLERIVQDSLSLIRSVPRPLRMRVFSARLEGILQEKTEDLATGVLFRDNRFPNVMTALSLPAFADEMRSQAVRFAEGFLKSDLCRLLLEAQGPSAFLPENSPSFPFEDFTVWFDPGIVWKERNTVCSLRITGGIPEEKFMRRTADLWDLAVRTKKRDSSGLLILFSPDADGKWRENVCTGQGERAEELIRESSAMMKEKIRDESLDLRDFPASDDTEQCSSCRFARVCRRLDQQFGIL